ncbi:hypothetical protein GP486_001489 [Trichoglossum hirsutum]|uniref:YjgF-like protein n=1 Tax=Trichoglossum hirsutum TaxID=265104 RepID=A0A9P8LGR9_9PEZI|nr:hypothetical protein GP486_001489 [Trichoglossum hirsutum]
MSALAHVTPPGSAPPYKDLFSNATIVPSGAKLAFISSQWACDSEGNLIEGGKGDYKAQAKKTWENIMIILKGLGCGMKDVAFKKNCFVEFSDDIAKVCIEGALEAIGPEEAEYFFKSANSYGGYAHFHKPDVLFMVDIVVALPN